jgi:hypothetical protein
VRIRRVLGLALASIASGSMACTDGLEASVGPEAEVPAASHGSDERVPSLRAEAEVPRNSDGSPQILPPGPPSRPPYTIVLAYHDFGPQVMAFELIGMEWWQWEGGGSWEPGDRFDVRVVVYRGITLAAAQAEYPTVEGRADYRYVSFDDAMAHFDRSMAEIEGEGEPLLQRLHEELAVTRARVRQALGVEAPAPGRD